MEKNEEMKLFHIDICLDGSEPDVIEEIDSEEGIKDLIKSWQRQGGHPWVSPKFKAYRNEPCPCGSGKKFKNCCGKMS